jgi:hypothetical protein
MPSFAALKRFSPIAMIVGYLALYYNGKGFDRILPDLTGITLEKLQSKSQQLIIVAVAAVGIYVLRRVGGIPPVIKTAITVILYFVAGYNLALAIDPPVTYYASGRRVRYVAPVTLNPYGGR